MARFEVHSHSEYSNIRLVDCINKIKNLIQRAIDNGLSGIALTDHEALCGIPEAKEVEDSIKQEHPNFKVAIGNEIYLIENRDLKQRYFHFILIAKDLIGWQMLKELSSLAWVQSYRDRGMERVPTLKSELQECINKFGKGHLVGTTACLGGELSTLTLQLCQLEKAQAPIEEINKVKSKIHDFLTFCLSIFGDDFYIECAPGRSKDQLLVNNRLYDIAKAYNIKMVIGTDVHFLTKEDRFVHKAYLNSKDGEREVDSFYEYSYLQTEEEIQNNLEIPNYLEMVKNSEEIYNKIENFSIWHTQQIPEVEVSDYTKKNELIEYKTLNKLYNSDDKHDRYWVNQCVDKLKEKDLFNKVYLDRLEEEASTKQYIGDKLDTNLFSYPITLQHYIDMFWECGSPVGAGRGSSCAGLNHYLLEVTQVDPVKEQLPWFRYLNKERVELPDIDIDLSPAKRPIILQKIKEERGRNFKEGVHPLFKENLGCTLIATFATEKTKSSILTACRGYRTEEYPNGIDVDDALYLASLIPEERGQLWTLTDVLEGNEEKGRKPVTIFKNELKKYPGLERIIRGIENLIKQRGSHASGVILFDKDPCQYGAFMKTPSGDITTQFDLGYCEKLGMTKFDFLVTDMQDMLAETIRLLQKDNCIDPNLTLREAYNQYLHPDVLPLEDEKLWDGLDSGKILNVFQFDSPVGADAIKKIQPRDLGELTYTNGLMRLMASEKGQETPMEKYVRFKQNPNAWDAEMSLYGLSPEEKKSFKKYLSGTLGIGVSQEQLMLALMDPDLCAFSLGDANQARKIIAKKKMDKISLLKDKILSSAKNECVGKYFWLALATPQLGYSFSEIHARTYSYIGLQSVYLATYFHPVYWNTACLIVNSGSLEDNSTEEIVDIYEPEAEDLADGVTFIDLPGKTEKIRKTNGTDYSKIAKAIGNITSAGVTVSPVDINSSNFGFTPDAKNNKILYGLKALLNITDDIINTIISNRPYTSPKDFIQKVQPKKSQMISLIKAGAFDTMIDRRICMAWYLWEVCDKKQRLTLQNMPGLLKYNLVPTDTEERKLALRVYNFNRYLKAITKQDKCAYKGLYTLDERAIAFLQELGLDDLMTSDNLAWFVDCKAWDKIYQKYMDVFRDWLSAEKDNVLEELNSLIFKDEWEKYAKGTISAWEMEVMCFYYHEHELAHLNTEKYGISNYFNLPEEPVVERSFFKGGKQINLFKLDKIAGTVIAKNKTKSSISLLTTAGVVEVSFRKEYFSLFDRQISEKLPDGSKKVIEKSWFARGSMIVVQGMRSGDRFIAKNYSSSGGHTLYKINEVMSDGEVVLQIERALNDE